IVDPIQCELDDLDSLFRRRLTRHLVQLGGEEQPDPLIGEAGARVELLQLTPVAGGFADLLRQLPLRTLQRRLSLNVELAGRELVPSRVLDRFTRLLDPVPGPSLESDHADRAGVHDNWSGRPAPDGVVKGLHPHRRDRPAVDELGADLPKALLAHAAAPAPANAASSSPAASAAAKKTGSSAMPLPMCSE